MLTQAMTMEDISLDRYSLLDRVAMGGEEVALQLANPWREASALGGGRACFSLLTV